MFIFMRDCAHVCVYVCTRVHYLEKNIKSKKSVIAIIEFTLETTQQLLHIHVKYCHDTTPSHRYHPYTKYLQT